MAKKRTHKKPTQQQRTGKTRVSLNAWLYPGEDDFLLGKLEDHKGERSDLVVRALEVYFSLPASERRDPNERLAEEISLLRQAIQQLPNRLISQLTTLLSGFAFRGRGVGDDRSEMDTKPVVGEEELKRRRSNREEHVW